MASDYDDSKPELQGSSGAQKQGDASEHQKHRNQREPREGGQVVGQATTVDPVDGSAADGAKAPEKAEGRQHVPHRSPPPAGISYVTIFNGIVAFTSMVGMLYTGYQITLAQTQLKLAKIAVDQTSTNLVKVDESIKIATRQADAAKDANDISMKALVSADRPWVFPQFEVISSPLDQEIVVNVKITNSGRTPALKLTSTIDMHSLVARPSAVMQITSLKKPANEEDILYPMSYNQTQFKLMREKEVDTLRSVSTAKTDYIIGDVSYEDMFGKKHKTSVCKQLDRTNNYFIPCNTAFIKNYVD